MVPKIAKAGTSFKAAGKYYLHDKLPETGGSNSSKRVAFTHTQNMLTNDPQAALKVMAWTAMHQKQLKEKQYRETHPNDPQCQNMNRAGRPTKGTVYHYSLSWHQEEIPSKEQMIEAASETLKVLKLDEHEVLMVAHNDEPQKHIHVIVNKIHPETGRVAPLKFTKERLSEWALEYEKEHGKIYCEDREGSVEKRRGIEEFARVNGKAPEGVERPKDRKSLDKADYYRWKREQDRYDWQITKGETEEQYKLQGAERKNLIHQRDAEIAQAMAYTKAQMRPHWTAYYRRERAQRELFEDSLSVPVRNLEHFLKNSKDCVRFEGGWLKNAWSAMTQPEQLREAFEKQMKAEKAQLHGLHDKAAKTAMAQIHNRYRDRDYQRLVTHAGERFELRKQQDAKGKEQTKQTPQRYQKHLARQEEYSRKAQGGAEQKASQKPAPLSRKEREKKERDELVQIFGSTSRAEKAIKKLADGSLRKENVQSRGKGRTRTHGHGRG